MSKGLDNIDKAKISNAFDYRTSKGCMIEIDNLEYSMLIYNFSRNLPNENNEYYHKL